MKTLILSITAGQGHNFAAGGIKKCLERQGVPCSVVDTYEYITPVFREFIDKGYLLMLNIVPKAYKGFYRLAEKQGINTEKYTLNNIFTNALVARKFERLVNSINPDVIICTHVFSAHLINAMKKFGKLLDIPAIAIVTDYTIHPFWQNVDQFDYIITPSELLNYEAMRKGLNIEKVIAYGMPVNEKFHRKISKLQAREQLGYSRDKKMVLLMSGGGGNVALEKIIPHVDIARNDLLIVAVAGKSKRLKRKIDKLETKNELISLEFVNNIDVLMDAADVLITKPGGITTSEALCKELPIILVNPIPGQEDRNAEFFLNNGAAMLATKTMPVEELLYQFFVYPERSENMRQNMRRIAKKDNTKNLCELIKSLGQNIKFK